MIKQSIRCALAFVALLVGVAQAQQPVSVPGARPGSATPQPFPKVTPRTVTTPAPQRGNPPMLKNDSQSLRRLNDSLEQRDGSIPLLEERQERNGKGLGTSTGNP
ncbi:hypothetical protein [Metapseudomonas boanensis]|uniref:Uncharacterized protein n=1 Tax=Metapseudomonas boanensis TaxID=2822138 RepID=A0ABS5XHP9_9GAMM|nr:hypothetical protein [Pseudomonas boanensis]